MLLRVYSNRFLRNHMGKVVPRVFPSCWKLSRFRPNPTWCILRRGLKTIWGNFQAATSDSYFWKKRNDWVSYKTTTTNLNRNHMAYPTLFHALGTQCLVAVFLLLVCFLPGFFPRGHIYIYIYISTYLIIKKFILLWYTGEQCENYFNILIFSYFIAGKFNSLVVLLPS